MKEMKQKPMSRVLALLLAFTMIFTMMPGMVWADDVASNVVTVSSSENLPSTIDAGTTVKLDADITLASGQQIENLEGVLDGQGHTITLADKPLANDVKGTIQNLLVTSDDVIKDSKTFGAMAVTLTGTIRNCGCIAKLELEGWNGSVGGVVGAFNDGIIQNVYFAGSVVDYEGGIAGEVQKGTKAHNSYYTIGLGPNTNCETKNCEKVKADDLKAGKINKKLNNDLPDTGFYWASPDEGTGFPILKLGKPPVAKEELVEKIATAKKIENDNYTDATWKKLQDTIAEAEVLAGEETVTQQQVDDMVSKLSDAISGLLKNKITEPVAPPEDEKEIKHIKTADELQNIKSPGYYVLDNDLTLGDEMYWAENTFNGVLEGNGHTITLKDSFTGMFDSVGPDGVVQNLHITGSSDMAKGSVAHNSLEGVIINCFTDATGANVSGFTETLKGGAIVNSYSVSKAKNGVLFKRYEKGYLKNTYWREDLSSSAIDNISEENLINSGAKLDSELKSGDFVELLNANRGTYGTKWGQNAETGYPYFGENQQYVPEWERPVPENKTAVSFKTCNGKSSVIENQQLTVNLNSTKNKWAGDFELPGYNLKENEKITWSISTEEPEGTGAIGEDKGNLHVYKRGRLKVVATLHKADNTTEVLATIKVTVIKSAVDGIQLCLADEKGENVVAVTDGKATVQGSEWKKVVVKAKSAGESEYQVLASDAYNLEFIDGTGKVFRMDEKSKDFQFTSPGTAKIKVTYNNDKNSDSITATAEITSEYVPLKSIKPGISGTITLHGRNANSDGGKDFNANYAGVIVTPSNASACHYNTKYTITSSDKTVGEYIDYLVKGYVPYKAGKVKYTASVEDNGKTISGSSDVEYVYKNPLKYITVNNKRLTVEANQSIPAGLVFHGALNDGHEVSDTTMEWTYSKNGIVTIERENGGFKRDENAPDNNQYFLSNEYTIRGLEAGTVTVTGTPVDKTGGASAVSFDVTVTPGEAEEPVDSDALIAAGLTDAKNFWKSKNAKEMASFGNEWYFFSLSRAGVSIDSKAVEDYLASVAKAYTTDFDNDKANKLKPTTIARTILAVGALGKKPANVGGVNLIEMLYNSDKISDGGNEAMWALIALNSGNYTASADAKWNSEKLIKEILEYQSKDEKGFSWSGKGAKADIDGTAMAIQALAPYYKNNEKVKKAVDGALEYLKDKMNSNCQFGTSEAGAQVLIALTSLGKDPLNKENGFVKSVARNLVTGLDAYRIEGRGFKHLLTDSSSNNMATQQALLALESCRRLKVGEASIYDVTDLDLRKTLENRVAEAEALKEDYYKADLWKTMVEAKDAAKAVLAKAGATDEELKAADKTLADALSALYVYNPNPGVAAEDIIVNITIAEQGKLAVGRFEDENVTIGAIPITVQDRNKDGKQDIDEVLYALHEKYYAGGAKAGYACDSNGWLKMLWGKDASASGMWVNNISAGTGAKDTVNAGDNVSVFTYKDTNTWSDKFTKFDQNEYRVTAGEDVNMSLEAARFDENYQTVWEHAGSVTISLLNGRVLGTTGADGKVKLSGLAQGTHKVIASAADGLTVPAVATIVVRDPQAPQDKVSVSVVDPNGKTYLAKTSYDFEAGDTALSLLAKTNLKYTAKYYGMYGGYYVSEIEGLAEFDKGPKSGWMYKVNGSFPGVACSEYKLNSGDYVEWLYTTDLGNDIGAPSESKGDVTTSGGAVGGNVTSSPTEVTVSNKTNTDGTTESTAVVTVKKENQEEIIKQAKENNSKDIVLDVAASDSKGADNIQLELPKDMVNSIVKETEATVTVKSEQGEMTIDKETLIQISKEAKGATVVVNINKAKTATEGQKKLTGENTTVYKLTVKSGNDVISQFNGKVTVKLPIPAALLDKKVAAVHFDSADKFTEMTGKRVSVSGEEYYVFDTTHFSEFGLVDAKEAGIAGDEPGKDDKPAKVDKVKEAKEIASKMNLTTVATKTKKKTVKVNVKMTKRTKTDIKALKKLGYNVKYSFYRSTKKNGSYKVAATKKANTYTYTKGKKAKRYYYKTQVRVYDKKGKLITKTTLKNSKYASRVWVK